MTSTVTTKKQEDTVVCMDDETFSITETLRDFEIDETELSRNFIHTDNDLWTYNVTDAYLRGVFI